MKLLLHGMMLITLLFASAEAVDAAETSCANDAASSNDLTFAQSGKTKLVVSPSDSAYPGKKWLQATITAKNTTNRTLYVSGYSREEVFVDVATKDPSTKKWVARGLGYCGNGADDYPVKPGETFSADVSLPIELADRKYRITAMIYSNAHQSNPKTIVSQAMSMPSP